MANLLIFSMAKDEFAYIRNTFTANAEMLEAGTVTQKDG